MGQTADQIEHHIEQTRETLGSHLQELEHKVKSVTDWRQHFQKNPMTMIGIAFGGGVLLATMLGGRKGNGRHSSASVQGSANVRTAPEKHKALETWDNIRGALIGVAATRLKDYVGNIIPGFTEQLQRTQDGKLQQSGGVH